MAGEESIKVTDRDRRESKKRKRELLLAGLCFLAIAVLTWAELKYMGVGSYLFLGLFNVNFILLIIIFFIVVRNGVKLLVDRRRKVLGSRLRTRLVLTFMTLSLVPTVLMFLVSVKFVQTSVDYWFQNQVEESMQQALELGRSFYQSAQDELAVKGEHVLEHIRERKLAWGGKTMNGYLEDKRLEYGLSVLGVAKPDGKTQNWHADPAWKESWTELSKKVDWDKLEQHPRWWSSITSSSGGDMIVGLLPVDEGKTGWLVLARNISKGLLFKLDQVVRGLDEYKKLKNLKQPWKMTLYLTLGVMTMLIILGAIWFGFRIAKELSAPVQALAKGTQRVARGDLSVRLEDRSADELGFLVQSFNRMAEDLEQSRDSLRRAYERVAQQNLELEGRGKYMEAVLNNITAGVVSLDAEGRISTVNNAAQAMLAISTKVVGRRPLDLLVGELAQVLTEVLEQMREKPNSQWQRQITLNVGGRDCKFLVNVVSLSGQASGGLGLVAVFEDITELEKMQRLAAWREVARRIAHEIKNPLTPIKLSAQRVHRKFGAQIDDPVFGESLELVVRQVEHIHQMVSEFSTYAKLPEVRPQPGFLAPLMEEVVALFTNSHSSIDWGLHFDNEIPRLSFDHEGIRRVFINLLTNAAEALPLDGNGNGNGDGDGGEPARVDIHASHDAILGIVRIEVRDNGPGFSQEERLRMFEPYFSSKKGGTGLGLTIVKSIVNDHRGFVRVKPNKPSGTIFVIELPA